MLSNGVHFKAGYYCFEVSVFSFMERGYVMIKYSKEEVMQFVQEEEVKFILLTFCDVFGKQKNITIMPEELPRAFEYGIAFDASAIAGFGDESRCKE